MKKKIIVLGFLVCFLVTLAVLPASAKTPSKPSSDNLCSVCEPTWWFLSDEDHAFYHCESTCQCSVKICPACGNNSVAVYCYSSHDFKYWSGASGKSWGQTYTLTSKCGDCSKQIVEECVYYEKACYQGTYMLTTDPAVSPTCISRGFTLTHCSQTWHTDCAAALGYSGRRYAVLTDAISEHSYSDLQHVSPTCTEAGGDLRSCSTCSLTIFENKVDALGHEYSSSITKEPTCKEEGYTMYTCSVCAQTFRDNFVPKVDHNYSVEETKKMTCTEDGVWTYTCSYCSHSYTEPIPKTGHVTNTRARFTESGQFEVYDTCIFCYNEFPTEDPCHSCVPHQYSCECGYGWSETSAWGGLTLSVTVFGRLDYSDSCSDCGTTFSFSLWSAHYYIRTIQDGKIYDICDNCGKQIYIEDYNPDVGGDEDPDCVHDYARTYYPPTCTDRGYYMYVCIKCSSSYIDSYVDALGHDPQSALIPPTCTTEGYTDNVCKRDGCGEDWISDRVPPLGHNFINGLCTRCGKNDKCVHSYLESVVPPSCHDFGYTLYTCTQCGDSYMDNYTKQLTHQWRVDGVRNPTCELFGYKELTCTLCGEFDTEDIAPYGHKWVIIGSEVQDDHTVNVTSRCTSCGKSKVENLPTEAAQAQNWLVTCMRGLFSGFADMYNIIANGVEIGGVTLGMVVTAVLIVLVLLLLIALAFKILG